MNFRVACLLLLIAALAACAPRARTRAPAPAEHRVFPQDATQSTAPKPYGERIAAGEYPRSALDVSGPAVISLLRDAQKALDSGQADQAVALIERALRIEPRNPFLWQALAGTHLRRDMPDQAESIALKSNSLARGNPHVELENWRLIAQAREVRGDFDGARAAEEMMTEAQGRIGY